MVGEIKNGRKERGSIYTKITKPSINQKKWPQIKPTIILTSDPVEE